jgi:hypothetical protein
MRGPAGGGWGRRSRWRWAALLVLACLHGLALGFRPPAASGRLWGAGVRVRSGAGDDVEGVRKMKAAEIKKELISRGESCCEVHQKTITHSLALTLRRSSLAACRRGCCGGRR